MSDAMFYAMLGGACGLAVSVLIPIPLRTNMRDISPQLGKVVLWRRALSKVLSAIAVMFIIMSIYSMFHGHA